ncbi:MAG TPA: family 20 glycosylhydrolase, partial [Polyangiaceae bacterium]|nr:family 20 glycosylhydrolase [Polyangiaceae bacterium]
MRRALLRISTLLAASATACIAGCQSGDSSVSPQDTSLSTTSSPNAAAGDLAANGAHARGPDISITFHPVDHTVDSGAAFFLAQFTVENHSNIRLGASGWKIYFTFVERILNEGEGSATLTQQLAKQGLQVTKGDAAKSGDYYALQPLPNFVPIEPGGKRVIPFLAQNWAIQKSDAPAGYHIVFPPSTEAFALHGSVDIDPSDPKQTKRFVGDVLPTQTPALRFDENTPLDKVSVDAAHGLLPTPQSIHTGAGSFRLAGGGSHVGIEFQHGLAKEAAYLEAALEDSLDADVDAREQSECHASIRLLLDPGAGTGPEAYSLSIDPAKGVEIRGTDAAGVFYGIQTLRQLVASGANDRHVRKSSVSLPELTISDAPLFHYRGMTLDVARHFQSKATVEKLLDVLAAHKINKLHLRLADDEGWRLEVPGIPELTSFGAHRGFDVKESQQLHPGLGSTSGLGAGDNILGKARTATEANGGKAPAHQGFEDTGLNFIGQGSGFYTTHEFEQILAYAGERHIDVIPEFDVPGHARAAVKAMEHRFTKFAAVDPVRAGQYRLVDPNDASTHTSVQGYTDNFVNPCLPSAYAFLGKVVHELQARYQAAGVKIAMIHGGGDELPSLGSNVWWQGSPLCKSNPDTKNLDDVGLRDFFFTKYQPLVIGVGAKMTGWDDIIHDGLKLEGFIPMPWSNVWG